MSIRVIQQPTTEIVTLAEAKAWARVDITADDALMVILVRAVREYAESLTGRALVSKQLELQLDKFPDNEVIELPYPPLQSVDQIVYIDGDNVEQTLTGSPTPWREDIGTSVGRVAPLDGASWPGTRAGAIGAVKIRFTCGYASMADVPATVRVWMQARLATFYNLREQMMTGVVAVPRDFVDGLLDELIVRNRFA